MKFKKESIGYVVIFTFIVCVAFVIFLSVANQLTLDRVKANKSYESHFAVLRAFGLADANTPKDQVESIYAASVKELATPDSGVSAYSADIDGTKFLAVKLTNPGLWGPITGILAADIKAERIRGFAILDQQETPGLGGRISEPWFTAQFKNEKVGGDGTIAVIQGSGKGDPDSENGQVDAITGASRTSDFVKTLVNKSLDQIRKIGGSL